MSGVQIIQVAKDSLQVLGIRPKHYVKLIIVAQEELQLTYIVVSGSKKVLQIIHMGKLK